MDTLRVILMGLVEGITEFLPISSTGHLILAGKLIGFDQVMGEEAAKSFEIVIQLGAILAVVAAYPDKFLGLLRLGQRRGFAGLRGLSLLLITSIPAGFLALATRKLIQKHLFCPETVVAALAIGAVWILAVEHWRPRPRTEGLDALTWREALGIGLFQCFSLWPGMSRSASTILGGMIVGVERKTATEYSFLAAVPLMLAATCYEFTKSFGTLSSVNLEMFALGFIVAFFSAWAAVKLFIRFLGRHTLVPFGWYRLIVAGSFGAWLIYAYFATLFPVEAR